MAAQYINIISTQIKHHQNVEIEGLNGLLGLHLQLSILFFCKGFFMISTMLQVLTPAFIDFVTV